MKVTEAADPELPEVVHEDLDLQGGWGLKDLSRIPLFERWLCCIPADNLRRFMWKRGIDAMHIQPVCRGEEDLAVALLWLCGAEASKPLSQQHRQSTPRRPQQRPPL